MKKIIITLILVLLIGFALLHIIGRGDEYTAEKIFHAAMKANSKIVSNPDVAPPKLVSFVENNLTKITKIYPDSKAAKGARMALAEFYVQRKRYDDAIAAIDKVISTEADNKTLVSKAHFFKGLVYEKKDQWDKAVKEYKLLRDEFTDTAMGLQMPLYIGRYYAEAGNTEKARSSYEEAAKFYSDLESGNQGNIMGYTSQSLLCQTYIILERYEDAGIQLQRIIANYPGDQTYMQNLPSVELVYINKLNNPLKALEIYKSALNLTTSEQLKDILQTKIGELEAK